MDGLWLRVDLPRTNLFQKHSVVKAKENAFSCTVNKKKSYMMFGCCCSVTRCLFMYAGTHILYNFHAVCQPMGSRFNVCVCVSLKSTGLD